MSSAVATSLATLDWRRQVFALHADVRRAREPAEGHRAWVAGRNRLLSTHPASPVPAARRGGFAAPVGAYDPALRYTVPIDPAGPPATWSAGTSDGAVPFSRLGTVHLPGLGRLDVWWLTSYGGGVFLPVHDTSPDTYGGGRYVLDTVKGADLGSPAAGVLVVDLNFAYNPSCAYSPAWTCPLAPQSNRLAVPVPGGERVPTAG
jgi:uncharacterized protein (DUF1684 family)